MRSMIRFVQIIQSLQQVPGRTLSEKAGVAGASGEAGQEGIDELIRSVKDWKADIVLITGDGSDFFRNDPAGPELIHQLLQQLPDLKIIVLAGGRAWESADWSAAHQNWPVNLIVLHEFESIFLEDQGLLIHGGFFMAGGKKKYIPELEHLDPRWPNILLLPDHIRTDLTRERIPALHRFTYTTLDPWLKDQAMAAEAPLAGTACEYLIFGTIENGRANWLSRQGHPLVRC